MPRQPHELFDTPEEKAALEARNGLLQFETVEKMVRSWASGFVLSPDTLRELHRLAIQNIYICAGNFRTKPVYLARNGKVDHTEHQPPPAEQVVPLVEKMCEYVNRNFN